MAPPTKTPSTPQSNTLFNYFNRTTTPTTNTPRTPPVTVDEGEGSGSTPTSSKVKKEDSSPKTPSSSSSNIVPKSTPSYDGETPKKSRIEKTPRRRIRQIESDSDDEENKSPNDDATEVIVLDDDEKQVSTKKKEKKSKKSHDDDDDDDEWVPSTVEDADEEEDDDENESGDHSSEVSENEGDTSDSETVKSVGNKRKSTPAENPLRKKLKSLSGSPIATQFGGKKFPMLGTGSPKTSSNSASKNGTPRSEAVSSSSTTASGNSSGRTSSDGTSTEWKHLKYDFLKPEKRLDECRRPMSHTNYDPTTLYVPANIIEDATPVQKQWWEMKRKNFDKVLFFKMGKFYEFFHMDAVVVVEELNIVYMKGDYAHAGFPEKAYAKFSNIMIQKGYKIARIEQTETPQMMEDRRKQKKGKKDDKVVNREICQISTRGVRTVSALDDPRNMNPDSTYLYCIYEQAVLGASSHFGVCFIDTTIGEFHIGQFEDDRHFSRLRTLFSHNPPVQIVLQKGNLVQQTELLINNYSTVQKEVINLPNLSHEKVLTQLRERDYFTDATSGDKEWPEVLQKITESGQMSAAPGWEIGVQAFGLLVHYLKLCLADHDLLSLKRFSIYRPVDSMTNEIQIPSHMVLDDVTLQNLDITDSSTPDFSLLSKVNRSFTPFGRRMIRTWMCMPLAIPREIENRLDAIQELRSMDVFCKRVSALLKPLPDLERLLNKVHVLGSAHRKHDHPDGRAIMFEEVQYSKNKIKDLLSIIKGFRTCAEIIALLEENNPQTEFLLEIVNSFPKLDRLLNKFDAAFDHADAQKQGKIIPKDGMDSEYDAVEANLAQIIKNSEKYLKQISVELKTRVTYFGTAKNRFQLEVSAATKVPRDFDLSSSRKGFKRYMNQTTKEFLEDIQRVEIKKEEVLRDITRRVFEKFDTSHDTWKTAVDCIAVLDAILSLKTFSESQEEMCRPKVVCSRKPFIKIKNGRHPCMSVHAYIANSCYLGVSRPANQPPFGSFALLTGPNMGGKSTLMRQVALITVLAQMGCYVPATSCEMSVIDRIFTRLGASDNLGDGESTFFVELSEASAVLRHCSKNSLVLMDELGRGTATYDGTAIAYAVATKLAKEGVRCLFSTHYHTLVESIQHLPMVQLGHMACMVENENEDDPTQETVTFLYKIAPGPCPKSYGFNAAKLAGMPKEVIRCGHQKAKEFETSTCNVDTFRKIAGMTENILSLRSAMHLLKI